MAIITNWSSFRDSASVKIATSPNATFANANPDTITRTDLLGDFVADGVEVGMRGIASGTALNDDRVYHVESLLPTVITLRSDDVVVAEGPIICTITFVHVDPDGVEQFRVFVGVVFEVCILDDHDVPGCGREASAQRGTLAHVRWVKEHLRDEWFDLRGEDVPCPVG